MSAMYVAGPDGHAVDPLCRHMYIYIYIYAYMYMYTYICLPVHIYI